MVYYNTNFTLPTGDRKNKREILIKCFLNEKPGTGSGNNASRYRYEVETYGQYKIFLKRPTRLNKGFDFTVNVEGLYFKKSRKYSNPSHQDIINALMACKNNIKNNYDDVRNAIVNIYNCIDVDFSKINATFSDFAGQEHPIQIILLAIKWLFMEQDCAYWNYSGRKMLFNALIENDLV